jgi:two-component system sensor histidine kinase KdpD
MGQSGKKGRLTIFFGSAAGVGKTYAMLEAARFEREQGRDVVVGVVETHGRYETAALLLGLELSKAFDLDAALARRPELILVDELASTNASGARHAKRWQDVDELLAAGIDVYTTLDVQHIESLHDVVTQITGESVRETVPDSVFENADDVRLIDLVPREGDQIALRELALRVTAQRVDAQMRAYRERHGIERTWAASERLLVCVSPSPASERLVRGARRLAASLHADWIAAYVETPDSVRLSAGERQRVTEHLRLAQGLGAETVTLSGARSAEEITRFARSRNVTRIVVGKPTHSSWRDRLRPSFLDRVVRLSGDIEIHVLTGEMGEAAPTSRAAPRRPIEPAGIVAAVAMVGVSTTLGKLLFGESQLADVVMIELLGIVLVSLRWGLWPSVVAAMLSVLALDFYFIPPFHTFGVSEVHHIATFGVMLLVAVVISGLTMRIRDQAEASRERELRTASLYSLSAALARAKTTDEVANAGAQHVRDVFGGAAVVLVADSSGKLAPAGDADASFVSEGAAEWTSQHGRPAGTGTDTLPSAGALYVPLEGAGVLASTGSVESHDRRQHLTAFARQISGALERTRLSESARAAQLRVETEQLKNSLLSSVSHDLRTPLAVITGAASTLLRGKIDAEARDDLTETVLSEAERLNRLVRNLLDMTRLEAGAVEVKKEWQPIEEAVGAALERVALGDRPIVTQLAADLPLVPYDSVLLQQVLVNLLENAAKYTPEGSEITISVRLSGAAEIEIEVADRGPGLPKGEEAAIFSKFYRAGKGRGGVGLGLTICQGIVTAHGGRIWGETRAGGGAAFRFTLPIEGSPPVLEEKAAQ